MRKTRRLGKYFLPIITLLVTTSTLIAFLPVSSANWNEILGVSGIIFTGIWGDKNCTHSIGYWKEHPEEWPVDGITIGESTYPKEEALLILDSPPQGDATYLLIHQLMVTKLNIFNGAAVPEFLEPVIIDAETWLAENPLGSKPKNPGRKAGVALAEVFEMYNAGAIGPGACIEDDWRYISMPAFYGNEIPSLPSLADLPDLDDYATAEGMLPELTGTPPENQDRGQPDGPSPSPGSEPPSTPSPTQSPDPTQPAEPTQPVEPNQTILPTPTYAPTQDPYDDFAATPDDSLFSTPTVTPTTYQPPTPTSIPFTPPPPTPTVAPTAYAGPAGCTQPVEYWLANPSIWPQSEFVIGPDIFSKEAALGIMSANPQGDATYILAGQYITAQLNIASPADPTAILEEIGLVKDWFINHPLGSAPQNPDRKVGLGHAKRLEEYNLGQLGPGCCQVPTPTPTATVTINPTPESSWTPTQAPTMEPTGLPPATETPTPELPTDTSP